MNPIIVLLLALFVTDAVAQNNQVELKGKVTSSVEVLDGIYIINKATEEFSVTQSGGYFSIPAKVGDTLMFSSIQFSAQNIVVTESDFKEDLIFVKLEPMVHLLDEIEIVNYSHINAVSLGIIPANQKKYTPAERRLKTAGDLKPRDFLGLLGGGMQADPIFNAISGRSAMLKKEVAIEKKEMLMAKIEELFGEKYFVDQLKIPELYVKGFLFYIAENNSFTKLIKADNKTMISFLLAELAVKYKDIISLEKE